MQRENMRLLLGLAFRYTRQRNDEIRMIKRALLKPLL